MARALLISTYDLGHQPFGLASPSAWLKREGLEVECTDLARQELHEDALRRADLIAFHLPMHTATRLAAPIIRKARALNAKARICAYGLYAPLNDGWLRTLGVDDVLDGEFEGELAAIGGQVVSRTGGSIGTLPKKTRSPFVSPAKLQFIAPDRSGLPSLEQYASLRMNDGTRRVTGYTEASRGCLHMCRHCPVVPVYQGQFRVVQQEVVLADVAAQVSAGAKHITFGDPDFFNGPTHAVRIVEELHRRYPDVTYDVTIKIEHLLKHQDRLATLRDTGCLFVTSAVESIDDRVLALLEKGHTRAEFEAAVASCQETGLTLVPTFVPFHPWMTLDDYCELLDTLARLDLVDHLAPIQLAIRLLVPSGSRLLETADMQAFVGPFDPRTLTHRWIHPDPAVDELQAEVSALVGRRLTTDRRELFDAIAALAFGRAGRAQREIARTVVPHAVPQMDEPWYCCAEPNPEQLTLV